VPDYLIQALSQSDHNRPVPLRFVLGRTIPAAARAKTPWMTDPIQDDSAARSYVVRQFWRLPELAAATGLGEEKTRQLVRAGCAPGPIYAWSGRWWSALSACRGSDPAVPPKKAELYYSRSAAWDLRRAALLIREGLAPASAAAANRDHFVSEFAELLPTIEGAGEAFPSCWPHGIFNPDQARTAARAEWATWLQGAYGVCLRVFNARNCIRKEALAARLKRQVANGAPLALLDEVQALAELILPFAPWERPTGTPGLTIDAFLARSGLGDDLPYR